MASRVLYPHLRSIPKTAFVSIRPSPLLSRSFQTSTRRLQDATVTAIPVKKPVGAFRGGLLGFLLGSSLAGASVYYYILEEYKVSNEMLTEDIYALQAATQRIHTYVSDLESKVDTLEKKK